MWRALVGAGLDGTAFHADWNDNQFDFVAAIEPIELGADGY
jgi:hypothetical protein